MCVISGQLRREFCEMKQNILIEICEGYAGCLSRLITVFTHFILIMKW
jgi:hypothetical protein